jgi:hypothetical protein
MRGLDASALAAQIKDTQKSKQSLFQISARSLWGQWEFQNCTVKRDVNNQDSHRLLHLVFKQSALISSSFVRNAHESDALDVAACKVGREGEEWDYHGR